ncbi:Protein transport protein Sec61 subunit alpha [Bienertia sinuspersici]
MSPSRSLLSAKPSKCNQLACNYLDLPHCDLFPRIPCCAACTVKECTWPAEIISHQVVLHLKHAHHPCICSCVQLVLHLIVATQEIQRKPFSELFGCLEGVRIWKLIYPSWWFCLLCHYSRQVSYYLHVLCSLADMAANPFHALSYIIFILSTCALFSKTLIESKEWLCQDTDSNLQKELNRYIPIVAVFGGVCIGALTVLVDFMVLLAQVLVFCLQSPSLTSILKHLKRREQANSASLGFKSRATRI